MSISLTHEPAVYVGTYAKYNNGDLTGKWISLEGHDKESFYEECRELHKDEEDPEFMFQDFQCFPRDFYGESGFDDAIWEWLELDDDERTMVEMYDDAVGNGRDIRAAKDAFYGKYESEADFSESYALDTGAIPNDCPIWITSNINWQWVWDSELTHSFCSASDGDSEWIFSRN